LQPSTFYGYVERGQEDSRMGSLGTVLVVEDEPLILMDIADTLTFAGFTVVEASSADRAVALLASGLDIDFLVTDVDMPGLLDGIALATHVIATVSTARVVITSGRYDMMTALPHGATFMSKPVSPERLLRELGVPSRKAA
jgi:DNA-binding NtrC family response regulator